MLVTRSIMALNSIAPAATVHKLQKLGVRTCRELMSVSAIMLMQWLDISHSSAVCLLATAAATITEPPYLYEAFTVCRFFLGVGVTELTV